MSRTDGTDVVAAGTVQAGRPLDAIGTLASCTRIETVVLAGGSGTRLWPVSRESCPKQLAGVLGADSLLCATVDRLAGFAGGWQVSDAPIVVCGEEHRAEIAEQLRGGAGTSAAARLVVEPARRDTAPALTLGAFAALAVLRDAADTAAPTDAASDASDGDAILVAMPADHAIADVPALQYALGIAARHAARGAIATLGVPPTHADTGFGYIGIGGPADLDGTRRIGRFVEKPAAELARQYVASGSYWWNSGIFVVRARVWLALLRALQPAMYDACERAFAAGRDEGGCFRPDAAAFLKSPADSIDYAVMERLGGRCGVVVPLVAGWSDLGSWDAVWHAMEKDANGNAARGRVVFEGATSCYAQSHGRLVACVGTDNIVVVETDDAVLVADRAHVQDVKDLVARIKAQRAPEADTHRKVRRPWGVYDSIDRGERFQVKRIVVSPGARLSLQLHHHRAEHWVVVSGTARVTRGEEQFLLTENESAYIPLGVKHRLENPGKVPLEIIEVQSGTYLGEDDIVRFDDAYGRCG